MASAKEFVAHVAGIEGVSGCLLMRADGAVVGRTTDDTAVYRALHDVNLVLDPVSEGQIGHGSTRFLSFLRQEAGHFSVFPIQDRYLLGVVQDADSSLSEIQGSVCRLIDHISTGPATASIDGS